MAKIFLTHGQNWTVPNDWTNVNSVECIGAGAPDNGSSGGGGAYSQISNFVTTPGSVISLHIGITNNNPDTWFNGASFSASSVGAKGGNGTSGGAASSGIGTIKYSGGDGNSEGSGGGGAAGPNGNGNNCSGGTGGSGDAGFGGAGASSSNVGSPGTEFDSIHGSGGGGGGGDLNTGAGGGGGLYGGGNGGGHFGNRGPGGGGGLIVITYTNIVQNHLTEYRRTQLPGPVSGPQPS